MMSRILRSKVVQRSTAGFRQHLTAHTVRVTDQQIAQASDQLRERVLGDVRRLTGDVDALTKRTSLQATNLAGSVRWIESLTGDVRELQADVANTRRELEEVRSQLGEVAAQLADVLKQLVALPSEPDKFEHLGRPRVR